MSGKGAKFKRDLKIPLILIIGLAVGLQVSQAVTHINHYDTVGTNPTYWTPLAGMTFNSL